MIRNNGEMLHLNEEKILENFVNEFDLSTAIKNLEKNLHICEEK